MRGMRKLLLGALLAIGCGDISQGMGALDAPGGTCPSRDTVIGTGDVFSVHEDPGQVGCDPSVPPAVNSLVEIDQHWAGRMVATSSSVELAGTGSAACEYSWSYIMQDAGCRWTVTVHLFASRSTAP